MTDAQHRTIETNGIRMRIAEQGKGPLVLLCHGFPESWYSWRHQLPALAEAGFHAVAPDMRGYGETDCPADIEQYTLLHLVGDMVGLLDGLDAESAVIAGHDWGAPVAWHAALLRPDRFRAVIGLSVPFRPRSKARPTTVMPQTDDTLFYQLYFQTPGVAETELERDVRHGLGTPGDHTFTVRVPQGNSVIDAARAAQRLAPAGLSADGPVAFMGYSEGGNATAAAAELQPVHAPELNLVGVASGGVPADLIAVAQAIDGGIIAGLEMSAIVGLVATYPDLPFDEFLNPLGENAFQLIRNSCTEILVTTQLFQTLENYIGMTFDAMFAAFPEWVDAADAQLLGRVAPQVPVFLYHGVLDPWIPLEVGEALRSDWCAAGATVEWRTYPLAEHILGIPSGYPDAVAFLESRFAGRSAVDNCP